MSIVKTSNLMKTRAKRLSFSLEDLGIVKIKNGSSVQLRFYFFSHLNNYQNRRN